MSALEDLIASNRLTYNADLLDARAQPRDEDATSRLKGLDLTNLTERGKRYRSTLEAVAKLASTDKKTVKASDIADIAVRGDNVTIQVKDEHGALSAGFFPLSAIDDNAATDEGGVAYRQPVGPTIRGGTATVTTVATAGGDENPEPPAPTAEGVPPDIDSMNATAVAALVKDPPDGVDPHAVVAHEFARPDGARVAVQRAAANTGLLDEAGNLIARPVGPEQPVSGAPTS